MRQNPNNMCGSTFSIPLKMHHTLLESVVCVPNQGWTNTNFCEALSKEGAEKTGLLGLNGE